MKHRSLYKMVLFLTLVSVTAFAQTEQSSGRLLKIGDKLPSSMLQMIRYPKSSVNTDDFRGKLLILDFWGTGCASCIAAFPKMNALQKKYPDQISIIPVTEQSKSTIEEFFRKRRARGIEDSVPSAVAAGMLVKKFPGRGLMPKEIWIDKSGVVIGITGAVAVNEYFIEKILNGEKVKLPSQENVLVPYNPGKPLLINGNGGNDTAFVFRSLLTPYVQGIPGGSSGGSETDRMKKYTFRSMTPLGLLIMCFNNSSKLPGGINSSRIINTSRFQHAGAPINTDEEISNLEEWKKKNFYNYELMLPNWASLKDGYAMGLTELSFFFKVRIGLEKRKMECLILTGTVDTNLLKKDSWSADDSRDLELKVSPKNIPSTGKTLSGFLNFIGAFPNYYSTPPIVNETGYNGKVEMRIPIGIKGVDNLPELVNHFAKYGLRLQKAEREIEVLVIEDNL